jgi:ankyrin repeat protein
VKLLLKHKADIEAANERCATPLYAAVSRGQEVVVKILLEAGADPNGPPSERGHPVNLASGAASPLLLAVLSATRPIAERELSPEAKQRHVAQGCLTSAATRN